MGEDLSTAAKIAIVLIIIVSIVFIVIVMLTLAKNFTRNYLHSMSIKTTPNYAQTIVAMSCEEEPIPVPSIYSALLSYGIDNLAQFDMDVNGVTSTDAKNLTNYMGKQFYVKVVEANDGLHVWVGDYY